ncbi:hypothetical protein J8273_8938 [Carpediemonas membranifera]|uniref:Uncharacterized protein n=1 Tax=Carpediemonas membranifera TaxID=201153 RepID=A0A8J6AZD6_9EUKA|nr:hypothetical protein J8273_8938 [Carpediemonas membranifera]|eukprot:KAG9389639.1 hypothetical protein J8273_8938 [Carpediemonas membranifera]
MAARAVTERRTRDDADERPLDPVPLLLPGTQPLSSLARPHIQDAIPDPCRPVLVRGNELSLVRLGGVARTPETGEPAQTPVTDLTHHTVQGATDVQVIMDGRTLTQLLETPGAENRAEVSLGVYRCSLGSKTMLLSDGKYHIPALFMEQAWQDVAKLSEDSSGINEAMYHRVLHIRPFHLLIRGNQIVLIVYGVKDCIQPAIEATSRTLEHSVPISCGFATDEALKSAVAELSSVLADQAPAFVRSQRAHGTPRTVHTGDAWLQKETPSRTSLWATPVRRKTPSQPVTPKSTKRKPGKQSRPKHRNTPYKDTKSRQTKPQSKLCRAETISSPPGTPQASEIKASMAEATVFDEFSMEVTTVPRTPAARVTRARLPIRGTPKRTPKR